MKALLFLVLLVVAALFGAVGASWYLVRNPESGCAKFLRGLVAEPEAEAEEAVRPSLAAKVADLANEAADAAKAAANGAKEAAGGLSEAVESGLAKVKAVTGPWNGFSDGNWYSGPKYAPEKLTGHVVLFCLWNCEVAESVVALDRMEELWNSFRGRGLVVIGSHRGGRTVKSSALVKSLDVSFALYDKAGNAKEPNVATKNVPYYYVVDHAGKIVYSGKSDRAATAVLTDALTAATLASRKLGK